MDLITKFNLQMFGEGDGDGGATSEGFAADSGEIEIPSSIPERAKERYKSAVKKHASGSVAPAQQTETVPTEVTEKTDIPYEDLIKSDKYKDAHKAYMDKTISDRLKKYKGIENELTAQKELLEIVAQKYGTDVTSDNFLETLRRNLEEDDSYYEKYAMEHDMSPTDARKIVTLERKVAESERAKAEQEQEERQNAEYRRLMQNAEATKKIYPSFDISKEIQSEEYRRILAAVHGDTTTAYRTVHWNELQAQMAQNVSQSAVQQATNAIKSNKARPVENGMNGVAPSVQTNADYSKMSLQQLRAQAEEWRRSR